MLQPNVCGMPLCLPANIAMVQPCLPLSLLQGGADAGGKGGVAKIDKDNKIVGERLFPAMMHCPPALLAVCGGSPGWDCRCAQHA